MFISSFKPHELCNRYYFIDKGPKAENSGEACRDTQQVAELCSKLVPSDLQILPFSFPTSFLRSPLGILSQNLVNDSIHYVIRAGPPSLINIDIIDFGCYRHQLNNLDKLFLRTEIDVILSHTIRDNICHLTSQ